MSKLVEEAEQISEDISNQLTTVQKNAKEAWANLEGLICSAKKDDRDGVRSACINVEIAIDYLMMDLRRIQNEIDNYRYTSLYPTD
jgi:hypothetical protein